MAHAPPPTPMPPSASVSHTVVVSGEAGTRGIREGFCEQNPQKLFSSEEYGREVLLREAGGPPQRQPIRPNYASLRASILTSLLFQFAFNSASQCNRHVVFICNRRKLESKPPYLSQGIDPSSDTFQRIQMKYVDDEEGIKNYFAAFHLHDTFPAAVVVDDFGDLFEERSCQEKYNNPRGRDLAMVRTLALCHNAVNHANKTGPCKLLLSDTHHGDSPRLLFIYKRWVPAIFTIRGDGSGSFVLMKSNSSSGSGSSVRTRTANYSIALQYLFLEGITQDSEL